MGLSGPNSSYQKAEFFLQALRRISFLAFYRFWSLPTFSGLGFPSPVFKTCNISLAFITLPSLLVLFSPSSSPCMDPGVYPGVYTGPTFIIQDNLLTLLLVLIPSPSPMSCLLTFTDFMD